MKKYRIKIWERTPSSADTCEETYDSYGAAEARVKEINQKMRSMYAPNPADYSCGVEGDIEIIEPEKAA